MRGVVAFFIENWFLFAAALISGALLLAPVLQRRGGGGSVTTAEAVHMINREKAVLIDVSEPAEYAAGHATGSRSIPFGGLETAKNLPSNKALPLVLMCATGARAGRAVSLLRKAGYQKVFPVTGGLRAWREANLPIEKTS